MRCYKKQEYDLRNLLLQSRSNLLAKWLLFYHLYMQFKKRLFYLIELIEGRRERDCFLFWKCLRWIPFILYLCFWWKDQWEVYQQKGQKHVGRHIGNAFDGVLIAFLVSTYLASFKEGLYVLTSVYFIIRSVLELSVLQNNHVGFCMMGVLKFLLYLVCLLGKKKVISSCFIRGPGYFFSQLSLVFLLLCSFYNYWVVQCSKMPTVDSW